MMLYGLTVENLLKAGLVIKGVAIKANGNFGLKTHNLHSLASEFGLLLLPEELEFVERLQTFVEWAGRYPIPLYPEGLYAKDWVNGSKVALYDVSNLDCVRINKLLNKIESQLPSEDEATKNYAEKYKNDK